MTRLLIVLSTIVLLASIGCASKPPKDACDYTYDEIREYFGGPGPAELDFDGDGVIRADDYNAWIAECGE